MTAREFNPLRLDVGAFARAGAELTGDWPMAELARLSATTVAADEARPVVRWSARGELRRRAGAEPEVWLHLRVAAPLRLGCRRCLSPVDTPVEVESSLRFVAGEAQAAALDAESEEDVLALTRALDLRELVEDELLLALPLAPRHEVCPEPLPVRGADEFVPEDRPNPFAVLSGITKPGSEN